MEKYVKLKAQIEPLKSVIVAFSGGVDSALVLKGAVDALEVSNVMAVTGRSPSVAESELIGAREFAAGLNVQHLVIDTDEFSNPNYLSNPTNRCYFCKTTLYEHLHRIRRERDIAVVVNGTNADDLKDYRPGLKAADEHGVRSPLAETGLTKKDIREISRELGLPTSDKPAMPCLSSRVAYGEAITPEKLHRIEAGEEFLHNLGIRECRVRHHQDMARIEVPPSVFEKLCAPETAMQVDRFFRDLGYAYVTLDLRGFRSGSLNDVIAFGRKQ